MATGRCAERVTSGNSLKTCLVWERRLKSHAVITTIAQGNAFKIYSIWISLLLAVVLRNALNMFPQGHLPPKGMPEGRHNSGKNTSRPSRRRECTLL